MRTPPSIPETEGTRWPGHTVGHTNSPKARRVSSHFHKEQSTKIHHPLELPKEMVERAAVCSVSFSLNNFDEISNLTPFQRTLFKL